MIDPEELAANRRQWLGSLAQTLIATAIVSLVGGGLGTYVAFRILEEKTEENTAAIASLRAADAAFVSQIGLINEAILTQTRAADKEILALIESQRKTRDDQFLELKKDIAEQSGILSYLKGRSEITPK